ncbi:MAG TPA: ABC transporter ATP-binding protein [Candidatus Saccharimonadia bacterium]|nr:ABC transporter ATP-binding protein [Candidatus Saccharimonadia bacterium]
MSKLRVSLRGVGSFSRTLSRVVAMNWRVSPRLYVLQVVITVVQGLLPLLNAFLVALVLGGIAERVAHPGPIVGLLWLMVAIGLLQFVINQTSYWSFYLDDVFGMQFDLFVQRSLFEKVHALDQTYYEDQAFNNQLNKISQNLSSMRRLNRNFLMAGNSVVQLVSTAIALVAFEPLIALAITLGLIPVLVIEVRTSMAQWRSWDERGNDWRLQWYLRGLLSNVISLREIKLYGLKNALIKRWEQHYRAAHLAQIGIERRAQKQRAIAGVLDIVVSVGSQAWLLLRVMARGSGLGSFVFYRQVIDNYASAGSSLVRNLHTMQESSLYVNDYFEMMALQPRLPEAAEPVVLEPAGPPPRIEFEKVSFRYPGGEHEVLREVSFVLEPGEGLAIVGANGAGKTTLIKLLLRLYDPTSGRILVDGQDLRAINAASWYRRIGALFQDFNRYDSLSVRDNIALGRAATKANSAEVRAAAEEAGANGFIEEYPHTYDQILNRSFKNGIEPSGGQWQRIALARAFYRDASILILDEPTSAIDAKGEFEIFEQIAANQREKSTIIISHRFSTVRNADMIIVLENGTITERGSHEQLVALGGRYHELFELQASGYR